MKLLRVARLDRWSMVLGVAALLASMVVLWVFGTTHYTVWCYSDMRAFLFPARDLASGHLPVYYPLVDLLRDYDFARERWFYKYFSPGVEGRLVSYVGHGFPLLLALAIRLFGITAPFLFNTVLLGFLPLILFGIMRAARVGTEDLHAGRIGILAGVMMVLIPVPVLNINLAPFRDLSKYVCILLAYLLLLLGQKKKGYAVPAGFLLGYAVWIKTDSLLMLLPVLGWFLGSNGWGSGRARGAAFLLFMVGFGLGLAPSIWQNIHDRGDWLRFPQLSYLRTAARAGAGRQFRLLSIPQKAPSYIYHVIISGLGGWALLIPWAFCLGWKRQRNLLLLFGLAILIQVLAGSSGLKFWRRYQLGTFLSLLPLLAIGADDLIRRMSRIRPGGTGAFVGVLVLCGIPGWKLAMDRSARSMTGAEARQLVRDLSPYLTSKSVIVCEDETRPTLDYLLSCMTLDRPHLSDARHDLAETIRRVMRAGYDLFYFDSEAVTPHHPKLWRYQPNRAEVRDAILTHFDLIPLHTIHSDDYRLQRLFGRPDCTLYRMAEWSTRTQQLARTAFTNLPAALRVNMRGFTGSEVTVCCDDTIWTQTVHKGWNVFLLPDGVATTEAPVMLVSVSVLPADVEPAFFDAGDVLTYRLGRDSEPFDNAFIFRNEPVVEPKRMGRMIPASIDLLIPFAGSRSDSMTLDMALAAMPGCTQPGVRIESGGWFTNVNLLGGKRLQEVSVKIDAVHLTGPESRIRIVNLDPMSTNGVGDDLRLEGFRVGVAK